MKRLIGIAMLALPFVSGLIFGLVFIFRKNPDSIWVLVVFLGALAWASLALALIQSNDNER